MKSGDHWILIVSISDWKLYREFYIQLLVTILLLIALVVTVILSFLFAKRSRKRAGEDALQRKEYRESRKKRERRGVNRQYRNRILAFMLFVMLLSMYSVVSATYRWGNAQMRNKAQEYENDLSEWISTQKSILDMFVSAISSNPDMLKDYEGTILAIVNSWDLHLIEFTLQAKDSRQSECVDSFIDLSANLLRRCDIIMKNNDRQVVFLLMQPENGDPTVPIDRVLSTWAQKGMPDVAVSYRQEQVNSGP